MIISMQLVLIFIISRPPPYDVVLEFALLDAIMIFFFLWAGPTQLKIKKAALERTEGKFDSWRVIEGDELIDYSDGGSTKDRLANLKAAKQAAWGDDQHRLLLVIIPIQDVLYHQKEIAGLIKDPQVAVNVDFEHVKDPEAFLMTLSRFVKVDDEVWSEAQIKGVKNIFMEWGGRNDPSSYKRK